MKTKRLRNSRFAPRGRGALPAGAVQLGLEQLEDRSLMAADLPFQNPVDRFDVNNDGAFNRLDVFALIGAFRLGGERTLGSPSGEGEAPSGGDSFLDVNGDNLFDRRDIFASIGHYRGEGEQTPTGNPIMMNYSMRVFSADGKTEFVDPDGAGPLGITVPKNTPFLLRVFVQDTGAVQALDVRQPGEEGIGEFSLDVGYHEVGNGGGASTGTIAASGAVRFEGTVGASPKQYQFPNNQLADSVYTNSGGTAPLDTGSDIQSIQGITRPPFLTPPPFLGLGQIMAFEIPFTAGSTPGTDVFVHTKEFTPQAGQTRIEATQDNHNVSNNLAQTDPNNPLAVFSTHQIQDAEVHLSIVNDTFANPDQVILPEQPDAQPPGSPQPAITVDVKANDFVPFGAAETGISSPAILATGLVSIDNRGTANRSDDRLVYRPNDPYFVGIVTIPYRLDVYANVGDVIPLPGGPDNFGTLTIDFREFNFAPIVSPATPLGSAPVAGSDEAALGAALTFPQGTTQTFQATGGAAGLLDNDIPGDPLDNSPGLGDEARPHQDLHIVGDPRAPFNASPFSPINPALLPSVSPAAAVRSISVNAAGNLVFEADPAYVGDAVITYFVEDNGLEQSLAPLTPPAAEITPKQTQQTLLVHITDVPDLAKFSVAFFADAAGTLPLLGEVDVNTDFFARVTVSMTAAGAAAGGTGVATAFSDLQFDDIIGGVTVVSAVPPAPAATAIQGTLAPDNKFDPVTTAGFVGTNLVDDTGGGAGAGTTPGTGPYGVYFVHLHSGNPAAGATSTFKTLFDKNQGNVGVGHEVTLFGLGGALLTESQITFEKADILIARGFRPEAHDDFFYAPPEGVTPFVPINGAGDTHGNAAAFPGPVVPAFDPTFGVLNNDTDQDAVGNRGTSGSTTDGNQLFGEVDLPSLAGVTHGVLSLQDPNTLVFIPVTGPGAQVPPTLPPEWKGVFQYVPNSAHINGTDTFSYFVRDSDGRKSLTAAVVTLKIAAVADAPVANDDFYSVVPPPVLTIGAGQEGNLTGDGNPQLPLDAFGLLNNDTDADVNSDPANLVVPLPNILTAHLVSLPNFGTLTLIDSLGAQHDAATDGDETQITWTATGATWTGLFSFVPTPGISGVVDSFTYEAIDETGLRSAPATVNIAIDLANITVAGRIVVDDSQPAPGPNPYPNTLGSNGRFEYQDLNGSAKFDLGDKILERVLGGVEITLTGTTVATPGVPSFLINTTTKTDSSGLFTFTTYLDPVTNTQKPIPKGNYQLIEDSSLKLKTFFFDGQDSLLADTNTAIPNALPMITLGMSQGGVNLAGSSNDTPTVLDQMPISAGAADVLFTEVGLRPQFIAPTFVSTSRSGVTIGVDNANHIVWYSIDSGPGWGLFTNQITGVTFGGGLATLSFTEPNANPALPDVTVKVAVPTSDAGHYAVATDTATGFRVIHFIGTAADLKTRFQVP